MSNPELEARNAALRGQVDSMLVKSSANPPRMVGRLDLPDPPPRK